MTAALLLADPSPALRLRALRELMDVPASDPEVVDLAGRVRRSAPVRALLATDAGDLRAVSWALCRLAFHGLDREEPAVAALAERAFARQAADGSFPLAAHLRRRSAYDKVPLQTALPLRGLAAAGYAEDPRAERAYDWLLAQRLDDGSWPTGVWRDRRGYVAGYRRLPGSPGCRANTTGALACLALHPGRGRSQEARIALDLVLQRETREELTLGSEVARLAGLVPASGFFTFYRHFDLAFVLELAARLGAAPDDPRVADLVGFLDRLRGPYGLWEHPSHPEASRWLTLEIEGSLRLLGSGDWVGLAPRTPFRPYPRASRRF